MYRSRRQAHVRKSEHLYSSTGVGHVTKIFMGQTESGSLARLENRGKLNRSTIVSTGTRVLSSRPRTSKIDIMEGKEFGHQAENMREFCCPRSKDSKHDLPASTSQEEENRKILIAKSSSYRRVRSC